MCVVTRTLGAPNMDVYAKGAPETIASLCQPQTGLILQLVSVIIKQQSTLSSLLHENAFIPDLEFLALKVLLA